MSSCNKSKCSSCNESCSQKTDFHELPHELSHIKKVICVVSGKGGVGKSLVAATLAVSLRKKGYKVGILDADITGPSMPKVFGIKDKAVATVSGIYPLESKNGIKVMSVNLLLQEEETPVIWRGPVISGIVKQFWSDVIWGELDVLLIDMPPGTGDVPLTVFQTIPLDGTIIVTSPQHLVSMIVKKSMNMAEKMNIDVLGIIENMSYMQCPDCGKVMYPFGESKIAQLVEDWNIELLAQLPIKPEEAKNCDSGNVENADTTIIDAVADNIVSRIGLI